jgi:1,4-dihydroxy-2-naphthoate octaprenyltransferase
MEKFLWNLGGCAIAALSVFAVLLLLARQDFWNTLFCVVCMVASWLYIRHRPTWLEV